MKKKSPTFTILTDVYWGFSLFKEGIRSVQNQTYSNLEIVIINNGADEEITDYILDLASKDQRIKILHYKENRFRWDDSEYFLMLMLNEALKKKITGDYIFYKSYDDLLSENYAECMVKLFKDDPSCLTASGRPVSVYDSGIDQKELNERTTNVRPRYMQGHLLVLDRLKGGNKWSAPGSILTIKRNSLIEAGGWDRNIDLSHFLRILPFGVTGFDENAILYWRRHEGQTNKLLNRKGYMGTPALYDLLHNSDLKEKWGSSFGAETRDFVVKSLLKTQYKVSANWFIQNLFSFNFTSAITTFKEVGLKLPFIFFSLKYIWTFKLMLLVSLLKILSPIAKPLFSYLNRNIPFLKSKFTFFNKILSFLEKN